MCIICVKNKGIAMPTTEVIENMWNNNPDGAGIMYTKKGTVRIDKGYKKLDDLKKRLTKLEGEIDTKKEAVVLHFRIGTAGGNTPQNTHPFAISDDISTLQTLRLKTDVGVAHNGVIHITPRQKDISDTMEYIASQLAPLKRAVPEFYKSKDLMTMISNAISSKMAFLTGNGAVYTIGAFVEDPKTKLLYSNTTYSYSRWYRSAYVNSYGTGNYTYSSANSRWDWSNEDDEEDEYFCYTNKDGKYVSEKMRKTGASLASDGYGYIPSSGSASRLDKKWLMPLEKGEFVLDHESGEVFELEDLDLWMDYHGTLFMVDYEADRAYEIIGDYDVYGPDGLSVKMDWKNTMVMTIADEEYTFEEVFTPYSADADMEDNGAVNGTENAENVESTKGSTDSDEKSTELSTAVSTVESTAGAPNDSGKDVN